MRILIGKYIYYDNNYNDDNDKLDGVSLEFNIKNWEIKPRRP